MFITHCQLPLLSLPFFQLLFLPFPFLPFTDNNAKLVLLIFHYFLVYKILKKFDTNGFTLVHLSTESEK